MSELIRYGLERLSPTNGFHVFEHLCLDFANTALGGHFVPPTGPVSAGGDGGQDLASFLRLLSKADGTGFTDKVVGICTTRAKEGVVAKIRSDLRQVAKDRHVTAVFAFLATDMQDQQRRVLQDDAKEAYNLRLEIFDGHRLACAMARVDFAAIAYRHLNLDHRSLSVAVRATDEAHRWASGMPLGSFRPELHDYLKAVEEVCRRHPWSFVDRLPDLDTLYQPRSLTREVGPPCTWQQALEQSPHVLLTGPAGAGKSSTLQHIAAALCSHWLDKEPQPWLPVPIHAHDLTMGKSLTQALAEGVERQLHGLLHRPLGADFFDREPPSAHWLVLIDGLDEVRDPDQRRDVLRVAEFAARTSSIRLMIASRRGGAATVPDRFAVYELKPFNTNDVRIFVEQWLALPHRRSADVARTTHALTALLHRSGWDPSPLVLLMICALADDDSPQTRPSTLEGLYAAFADRLVSCLKPSKEPVVNKVQDRIHTILAEAASHRLFEDSEAKLLDAVIESAANHGITPPARLTADWHKTVEEVLLRSGMVTKHRAELAFLHTSFEDHYALRTYPDRSPGGVVDALATQDAYFDNVADLVTVNLRLLEFLMDRTDDTDATIAALIEAYPSAVAATIEHFEHYDLGDRTAEALQAVADDRYESLDVRAHAAAALDDIDPGRGLPRRLALSINLDMENSDRLKVIGSLTREGGRVAAAIRWLTFETLDNTWDDGWKYEAAPLVTYAVSDEDQAHGLRLIADNSELPSSHRVAACCDLVEYEPDLAYRLLRSFTTPRWLALCLADLHRTYSPTLVRRFIQDGASAFTDRLDAISHVEEDDLQWARSLYDSLAQSSDLTDQQRSTVASAIKDLGSQSP
ncbi:NACHT domain-containing protein [Amycolatopsis magusensis]|uniref:NACHT domain-containing protein n=1 Tax=Amycolatopsis magusensis TaxID=882444 RepID=UPI0024A7A90A|nr:NACHT domain-containing protein [Amycolatopsis magusensis]MDI5976744.1 NACHT domain-containing protein [Amycolatopsis magusensis]